MSDTVPAQHPAVVLRTHYVQLRAMLAAALIAIVGLTVAVVILATDNGSTSTAATPAASASSAPNTALPGSATAGARLDHRGLKLQPSPTTRSDGGPEEGLRGTVARSSSTRSDGGPEEGTAGPGH